jgi:hypothetical protein
VPIPGCRAGVYKRTKELNRCAPAGRKWLIGNEFIDNGNKFRRSSTRSPEEDARKQFNANFWRVAFGALSGRCQIGVDSDNLYEIIEVRPATSRIRRPPESAPT